MTAAAAKMTEEQMVHLVRNALMAAGHEIGAEGDHWPAIKSTIYKILKDWENVKAEREITAELKSKFGNILKSMESDLQRMPADLRPEGKKIVDRMRELYDARFEPVDLTMFVICDEDVPIHVRRAEEMIRELEDGNGG